MCSIKRGGSEREIQMCITAPSLDTLQKKKHPGTQSIECHGFESHPRQLIFSRKSDCLGCAVLLCLFCLFDLACFFLSSFSSLI